LSEREFDTVKPEGLIKMKFLRHAAVIAMLAATFAAPAFDAKAQHHGGSHHGGSYHGGFRGHDIGHFGRHDFGVWRGGHWVHGWHGERFGWWWTFGAPSWYLYPTPIYPFPDPYIPPTVVVEPAAPAVVGQPPAQLWYYCDNPKGYYPYVATCNGAWRPVAPTPPAAR
jgi:hypothetical protein